MFMYIDIRSLFTDTILRTEGGYGRQRYLDGGGAGEAVEFLRQLANIPAAREEGEAEEPEQKPEAQRKLEARSAAVDSKMRGLRRGGSPAPIWTRSRRRHTPAGA